MSEDRDFAAMVGAAIAGYAVSMQLLALLRERKLLSDDDASLLIDRAIAMIEVSHRGPGSSALRDARDLLGKRQRRLRRSVQRKNDD